MMTRLPEDLALLRRLNPCPETSDPTWPTSDNARELLTRIVSAAAEKGDSPERRLRPRWQRPTTTIPLLVALSASALLFASAVAGDRTITVNAADALENPAAVERRLAEEGIRANIEMVPTGPALVGKWFHLYLDPKAEIDPETFALLESYVGEIDYGYEKVAARCDAGKCERTALLEIPGTVNVPITLVVGRPARRGETYWAQNIDWANELAPSGALYCMRLENLPFDEVERRLTAAGYDVRWTYDPRDTDAAGEESRRVASPPPGTAVTTAYIFEPGVVDLRVSPDQDVDRYRKMMGTPTATTGRPDFGTC